MTSLFGIALLPLWIMGMPLIGALISLALPAPRGNTIPHLRYRDGTPVRRDTHGTAAHLTAHPAATPAATSYPRT